jgi:predicted dehydrogenase
VPAVPATPRTFDIAVVGTGGIAGFHAESVARLDGRARIIAAVDTDPERLDAFCAKWSVPRRYPDLAAMLGYERPDLVDLATPPAVHSEQAVTCLARGLTVLCEKPPARSLAELDEIAAAEAAGGGRFATVFQHRFGSGGQKLRQLRVSGRLGASMTAVCDTLWFRPDDYFAVPWRGSWEAEGGGPTMGHGIHQLDLMLSILGEWREVVAVATRRARPTETEDLSAAIVTFESGAVATAVNSLLSPRETSYLRFDFAHATVELEHLYGYDDRNWRVTAVPGHEEQVTAAWAEGPRGQSSGHAAQLAAVFDAIEAGTAPPVALPDARATLELVAACYASAFTREPVARGQLGRDSPFYRRMDGTGAPWAHPLPRARAEG